MNQDQWNNLSDEEKDKAIGDSQWEYSHLGQAWHKTGKGIIPVEEYNPMGDMNLCMELPVIFRDLGWYQLGYYPLNRNPFEFIIVRDINNVPVVYKHMAKKLTEAICTAYAKAVGIITEE